MIYTNPKFYSFSGKKFVSISSPYKITWNEGLEDWRFLIWGDWDMYTYRTDIESRPVRGHLNFDSFRRKLGML